MEARIDEPRVWQVKCPACEHLGTVYLTLRRLREVNLKCSVCGGAKAERTEA